MFIFIRFGRQLRHVDHAWHVTQPARIFIIRIIFILERCYHKCVRIFRKKIERWWKKIQRVHIRARTMSLRHRCGTKQGWRKDGKKIRRRGNPHSRYSSNFSRRNIHERCCGCLPVLFRFYSLYTDHPVESSRST